MARRLVWLFLALVILRPASASADDRVSFATTSRLHLTGAPVVDHSVTAVCSESTSRCTVMLAWTVPPAEAPREAMLFMIDPTVEAVTVDGRPVGFTIDSDQDDPLGASRVRFTLPLLGPRLNCDCPACSR